MPHAREWMATSDTDAAWYGNVFGFAFGGDEIPVGSAIYPSLSLPADADKAYWLQVTSWPSAGYLFVWEDGSFDYTPEVGGEYTFTFHLYEDGTDLGQVTVSLFIEADIPLGGAAEAGSEATGQVLMRVTFSGSALGASGSTGNVTLAIPMSASAVANALATGQLDVDLGGTTLDADVAVTTSATGDLTVDYTNQPLAGAAVASSAATGGLSVSSSVDLAGAAVAGSVATGEIVTDQVELGGAAQAIGTGTGVLTISATDINAIVVAIRNDPLILTLPKFLALK